MNEQIPMETPTPEKAKGSAKKPFGNPYLSTFCMELSLLLDSGIPAEESVEMLVEDEKDKDMLSALNTVWEALTKGEMLSDALTAAGTFPSYMLDMVKLGEETGRTSTVLASLSRYYDRRENLTRAVRSAVIYPCILALLMLAVIVIIITKVLPVFNGVAEQMGVQLSGAAGFFTGLGMFLSESAVWIALVLLAALVVGALIFKKKFAGSKWGISIACARFSAAMSMGISSGLDIDRSLTLAAKLSDNPVLDARIAQARALMEEGASFPNAVAQAKIYRAFYAKMLSVGVVTGEVDAVMQEISDRCDNEVTEGLNNTISRIEPILVIVMSLLVGMILLSVMLPLTSIMTAL